MSEAGSSGSGSASPAEGAAGVVRAAEQVPMKPIAAGRATAMQVLIGPQDGAPNFVLRRFRMEEGGGIPRHINDVEHEQYVLRGRARITIDGTVHDVRQGDALFIPAGTPHAYDVVDGPFEFLCIVPDAPDRIQILDDGC